MGTTVYIFAVSVSNHYRADLANTFSDVGSGVIGRRVSGYCKSGTLFRCSDNTSEADVI